MTLQQSRICKGCWQQMHLPVPLRGMLSVPFRAFGIRPSKMNPNTCTICELMFTRVMRARKVTIDAKRPGEVFALGRPTSLDLARGAYRTIGMIFPPDGEIEDSHDGVANGLVEQPVIRPNGVRAFIVERVEQS